MRSLFAFMKKEFTEQLRSGRLMILGLLFVLFGIIPHHFLRSNYQLIYIPIL